MSQNLEKLNPHYALGFVVACPEEFREEVKMQ
jgi:hypothetical protein